MQIKAGKILTGDTRTITNDSARLRGAKPEGNPER